MLDGDGKLAGIITDGDLRRILEKTTNLSDYTASMVMTKNPKTISTGQLAVAALRVMEAHSITQLVVVDGVNRPAGIVHLHDLVKAGITDEG